MNTQHAINIVKAGYGSATLPLRTPDTWEAWRASPDGVFKHAAKHLADVVAHEIDRDCDDCIHVQDIKGKPSECKLLFNMHGKHQYCDDYGPCKAFAVAEEEA